MPTRFQRVLVRAAAGFPLASMRAMLPRAQVQLRVYVTWMVEPGGGGEAKTTVLETGSYTQPVAGVPSTVTVTPEASGVPLSGNRTWAEKARLTTSWSSGPKSGAHTDSIAPPVRLAASA